MSSPFIIRSPARTILRDTADDLSNIDYLNRYQCQNQMISPPVADVGLATDTGTEENQTHLTKTFLPFPCLNDTHNVTNADTIKIKSLENEIISNNDTHRSPIDPPLDVLTGVICKEFSTLSLQPSHYAYSPTLHYLSNVWNSSTEHQTNDSYSGLTVNDIWNSPFKSINLRQPNIEQRRISRLQSIRKRATFIPVPVPIRLIKVPTLQDDFYLNLLDWSHSDLLAVGVKDTTIIWRPSLHTRNSLLSYSSLLPHNPHTVLNNQTISEIPRSAIHLSSGNSGLHETGAVCDTFAVSSLSWSPLSGSTLAVGHRSGVITVWDVEKQRIVRTYKNHQHRVGSLDWCGTLLSSGSRDKSIIHRDLRVANDAIFRWDGHKQEVCGLRWSPTGCGIEGVLASGGNDNHVYIWQLGYDKPILKLKEHSAAVKALSWSLTRPGILATGGGTNDRCLRLWDIRHSESSNDTDSHSTCELVSFIDSGSQICNVLWSRTTSQIVTTHGFTINQINLWDVGNTFLNEAKPPRYATEHDAKNTPSLTLTKKGTFEGHSARVLYLAMHPLGDIVVSGAGDETLRFWHLFPQEVQMSHDEELELCADLSIASL